MINDINERNLEILREQNRVLLKSLATAQEFIAAFPAQILNARLDAKGGKETKYNYFAHNQILVMAGGSQAIRSQLEQEALPVN